MGLQPGKFFGYPMHIIRGQRVLLDADLARLWGVPTLQLNRQVRRNKQRFPADFTFRLNNEEAQILRLSRRGRGGMRHPPWVFTEPGAVMLTSVLNTPNAIQIGILVARMFAGLRNIRQTPHAK